MANRPVFITKQENGFFNKKDIEFIFYNGFSITQKGKSINSLHNAIHEQGISQVLEVSTKSDSELGWRLSAFNLLVDFNQTKISLECAFQGSKVFENGQQYKDLYSVKSIEAKKDKRLKESGTIVGFEFEGEFFENEPKTAFYDWLYINALYQNDRDVIDELVKYEAFTDIEFNPKRSVNCQARTCAILVSLVKQGLLEKALDNKENFVSLVYQDKPKTKQQAFSFGD